MDFLADLTSGGRALELAVGKGRVAIPLKAHGIDVVGIAGDDGRATYSSSRFRCAWHAEPDLMAQLCGMEFEARYAGWDRAPFTGTANPMSPCGTVPDYRVTSRPYRVTSRPHPVTSRPHRVTSRPHRVTSRPHEVTSAEPARALENSWKSEYLRFQMTWITSAPKRRSLP